MQEETKKELKEVKEERSELRKQLKDRYRFWGAEGGNTLVVEGVNGCAE